MPRGIRPKVVGSEPISGSRRFFWRCSCGQEWPEPGDQSGFKPAYDHWLTASREGTKAEHTPIGLMDVDTKEVVVKGFVASAAIRRGYMKKDPNSYYARRKEREARKAAEVQAEASEKSEDESKRFTEMVVGPIIEEAVKTSAGKKRAGVRVAIPIPEDAFSGDDDSDDEESEPDEEEERMLPVKESKSDKPERKPKKEPSSAAKGKLSYYEVVIPPEVYNIYLMAKAKFGFESFSGYLIAMSLLLVKYFPELFGVKEFLKNAPYIKEMLNK